MFSKKLLPLALAAVVASAQNLTEALGSQNATLSTFTALLSSQPDFVKTLTNIGNVTIFAPSNTAIQKFLNSSGGAGAIADAGAVLDGLEYTVLNGTYMSTAFTTTPKFLPTLLTNPSLTNVTGGQVVEVLVTATGTTIFSALKLKSTITKADITFTGGVIHIIDTILTIPVSDSATLNSTGSDTTSLYTAVKELQLIDSLNALHDITIFAPNNAAILAIGPAVPSITLPQFVDILKYHVVNGTVGYSTLLSNTTLKTLNGDSVKITVDDAGNIFVNAARVLVEDVLVANGVVHVIDNVLNPNNTDQALPTGDAPDPPAFSAAANSTTAVAATATPSSTGGAGSSTAAGGSSTSASASASTSKSATGGAAKTGVLGAAAVVVVAGGAVLLNL